MLYSVYSDSSFSSSLASSCLFSGISSQLCATCRQRKVPGRCCSPWTPRPCWWTSCHSAGLPSRGKVGCRRPGIPAWRQPVQPFLTSPSQSQRESGSWFTQWNTHLKPAKEQCFTHILQFWDIIGRGCSWWWRTYFLFSCLGRTRVSESWRPF